MSKKNPYTFPGRKGRTSHKRMPRQNRTKREVARMRMSNGTIDGVPVYVGPTGMPDYSLRYKA